MRLLLLLSIFGIIQFSAISQKTIDKVVAQVGDDIILLSDIETQKLQALQSGMQIDDDFSCNILESLMYQKLLITQAKIDSVMVSDEQVNAEMENRIRIIEQQIGSREKMEEFYGKTITQIKKEFFDAIKDQLLSQEMERQITSNVSVSPRDVEDFFTSLPNDSIPFINSKLTFQQIVIYPEVTQANKEEARSELEEIRKNIIEKGKSFSTQARIHSEDPGSASQGGEIKASRGMMVKPFEAAVFSLDIGGISEVFETTYGYHVVKLIDRKGDDYTCQHILITPKFSSSAIEEAALKLDSCYTKLKVNEITWNQAVLMFSNDESTKLNQGFITNPITGDREWDMKDLSEVDKDIYLITDRMEKGDISQPALYTNIFDRKQGVRIVRLNERTEPHKANLKDDFSLIKKAAENQKKQDKINNWTKSKVQSTFIKITPEYKKCSFVNPWIKN